MSVKKNGKKNADSDQDLKLEVAALASQLGLAASTGEDAGFDDTDFRPPKKLAGLSSTAKTTVQSQRIAHAPTPKAAVKAGQGATSRSRHGAQDTEGEAQKTTPGRTWKSGVGPRPGNGTHHSAEVTTRVAAMVVCILNQKGERAYGGPQSLRP